MGRLSTALAQWFWCKVCDWTLASYLRSERRYRWATRRLWFSVYGRYPEEMDTRRAVRIITPAPSNDNAEDVVARIMDKFKGN